MRKDFLARELTMEIVVGAFMVMILLGLGYFTIILSREALLQDYQELEIVFSHVMGLREGDNVVVRGMPVGSVKELELQPDGVHVLASLRNRVTIHDGYEVTIVSTSVLGGRHVEIHTGPTNAPVVTQRPLDGIAPHDLMADAAELINSIKSGLVEGGVIENIQKAAADLQSMIARVNAGKGTLGKLLAGDTQLYDDAAAAIASLRTITARLESGESTLGKLMSGDGAMYDDLAATSASLRSITARLENGEGTLGRLLAEDDTLYEDLSATMAALQQISERLEKGEGTLGKLVNDDKLYKDLEHVVGEARAAVDDYRDTSPVVTFTSIFFGAF